MDILSKLIPSLKHQDDVEVDIIDEAQEKKDRIAFHRTHVRNGPVKFKEPTTGQQRRAHQRALARRARKAYRQQVRTYFAAQREAAILRAKLQDCGVLAFVQRDREIPILTTYNALVWIIERYAEGEVGTSVEVTDATVRRALQAALDRYGDIVGVPNLRVPENFVLPFEVAA